MKEEEKKNLETTRSEGRRRSHLVWKEKDKKKKKEHEEMHAPKPMKKERKKKKEVVKSRGCDWQWVPPCSVIYGNAIELWVMETENS